MKGINVFCASQAATAICHSVEQDSSSSPSSSALLLGGGGGRAIDRHNPIIRDSRRIPKSLPPCTSSSQPPFCPKPQKLHHKKKIPFHENENQPRKTDDEDKIDTEINDGIAIARKSWSCTRPGDFISPASSSRCLLREKVLYNSSTNSDLTKPSVEESFKFNDAKTEEPSSSDSPEQVVVLRVSLHCRGCERKLRKHLSRMEGATSFDIDFGAKKVTVTGKLTPLGVLSSISKVKNAQLWSPTLSSSIPQSEYKNDYEGVGS